MRRQVARRTDRSQVGAAHMAARPRLKEPETSANEPVVEVEEEAYARSLRSAETSRGDAAAGTWIFCGDESDVAAATWIYQRRRVAATPRRATFEAASRSSDSSPLRDPRRSRGVAATRLL